jgi:hypothetical protein
MLMMSRAVRDNEQRERERERERSVCVCVALLIVQRTSASWGSWGALPTVGSESERELGCEKGASVAAASRTAKGVVH